MNGIRAHIGQSLGLDHQLKQRNCQDSYALHESSDAIIGVVCDGCSEGMRSEVGASLGAHYLAVQAAQLLEQKTSLADLPDVLYRRLIDYLEHLTELSMPPNRVGFVRDHLLFTVLMLIITKEGAVVLSAGDGLILMDEQIECIDQNNMPFYIAYHLLPDALPPSFQMPQGFQVRTVTQWQHLAIASDGFVLDLLSNVWGMSHVRGLQRKMNVWAEQGRHFRDDATLITIERVNEDKHPTEPLPELPNQ
jgi:hypothetical protein